LTPFLLRANERHEIKIMDHQIFISYASPDIDIIENLKDHLKTHGINAWVYSRDKTIAEDMWDEIIIKISDSKVMIFSVSESTVNAEGQSEELKIILSKIKEADISDKILPVVLRDTEFSSLPAELRKINGERLDIYNIKSFARNIVKRFFPELVGEYSNKEWHFPKPGDWLEITELDEQIEGYFDIGDSLYFRRISPIGLFECYSPKINELFWIFHENVKPKIDNLEGLFVPWEFSISGMVHFERMGYRLYHEQQAANNE